MIARVGSSEQAGNVEAFGGDRGEPAFTPQQDAAINLLATGYSVTDAAAVLGVSRSILDKWRNRNPAFEHELSRRRQEIGATAARTHGRANKI
jgi:transposase-like protein